MAESRISLELYSTSVSEGEMKAIALTIYKYARRLTTKRVGLVVKDVKSNLVIVKGRHNIRVEDYC